MHSREISVHRGREENRPWRVREGELPWLPKRPPGPIHHDLFPASDNEQVAQLLWRAVKVRRRRDGMCAAGLLKYCDVLLSRRGRELVQADRGVCVSVVAPNPPDKTASWPTAGSTASWSIALRPRVCVASSVSPWSSNEYTRSVPSPHPAYSLASG